MILLSAWIFELTIEFFLLKTIDTQFEHRFRQLHCISTQRFLLSFSVFISELYYIFTKLYTKNPKIVILYLYLEQKINNIHNVTFFLSKYALLGSITQFLL